MYKNKTNVMPVYPIVSCSVNDRSCQVKGKQNILQMILNVVSADFNRFRFNALSCSIQAVSRLFPRTAYCAYIKTFRRFICAVIDGKKLFSAVIDGKKTYSVTVVTSVP